MGLGIASVSYDSAALLRNFAERKDLHYPMLSDPESKMIRAFDILNDNFPKDHQFYGVPFPGMYLIDEHGVVKAKYFEDDHRERFTAASILVHQFGQGGVLAEPMAWFFSRPEVRPGRLLALQPHSGGMGPLR